MIDFGIQIMEELGWGDSDFVKKKKIRNILKDNGYEHNLADKLSSELKDYLKDVKRRRYYDEEQLFHEVLDKINIDDHLGQYKDEELKTLIVSIVNV